MSHRDRPNILLIMADQLPAATLGAYGHRIVRSPHIDALAARGVTFDAAYANCPICAPSRASLCTGRLVSNLGAFDNGADFPASTPTFMHHLRRAGYRTWLSGKMHFIGPDQLHGFERRLTPEIYPSSFTWTPDWTLGPVPNPGTAVDQLRTAGLCDWSMQLDYDEHVHFRAVEALRDLARCDDGRPFFLCASYTHPHDPFIITQPWWDLYDHEAIDPPAAPPLPIEKMHPYDQWLQIHHMVDRYPPSADHVRRARHAFYGMVSYFDSKVGELTAELKRLCMADNTIVIVTSDHGEMLGEHGMWFKRTYFEPSVRVPLIIAGSDRVRGARNVGGEVSLVDLFPTFTQLAGAADQQQIESEVDGCSLADVLSGDGSTPGSALSEYYSEGVCQPMRMAVKDRLKYVYVHEQLAQLFDLKSDPHELKNVIEDPAYADRLTELKKIVHNDWDPAAMRQRVIDSQRHRRLIHEATGSGVQHPWDVTPDFNPAEQFVRRENAQITNEKRRYPRIESD